MPDDEPRSRTEAPARAPRARRKDAALNNERLVQAARDVFARDGLSATLEEIAREAGVGVGTVYRNFASKREIVETLYDAAIDSALHDVQAALEIDDPWLALVAFFEVTAANQARDRGLGEALLDHGSAKPGSIGPSEHTALKIIATVTPLFDRAAAAGVIRQGVTPTDIWPIFAMLNGIYGLSDASPEL